MHLKFSSNYHSKFIKKKIISQTEFIININLLLNINNLLHFCVLLLQLSYFFRQPGLKMHQNLVKTVHKNYCKIAYIMKSIGFIQGVYNIWLQLYIHTYWYKVDGLFCILFKYNLFQGVASLLMTLFDIFFYEIFTNVLQLTNNY